MAVGKDVKTAITNFKHMSTVTARVLFCGSLAGGVRELCPGEVEDHIANALKSFGEVSYELRRSDGKVTDGIMSIAKTELDRRYPDQMTATDKLCFLTCFEVLINEPQPPYHFLKRMFSQFIASKGKTSEYGDYSATYYSKIQNIIEKKLVEKQITFATVTDDKNSQ